MAVLTQIRTRKSRDRAKVAQMRGRSKKDCLDLSLELPGLGAPDREILPVWRARPGDLSIVQFQLLSKSSELESPGLGARPGDSPGLARQTGRFVNCAISARI